MRSKTGPVGFRVLGQRSLHSSFSSAQKTHDKVAADDYERLKPTCDSTPDKVKVKSKPFLSLLSLKDRNGSTDERCEAETGGQAEKSSLALAFGKFKHADMGKGVSVDLESDGRGECSGQDGLRESRKRINPRQDGDEKHNTRKYFAVLGGNPKHKLKKRRAEDPISEVKPGQVYDHYENGSGWWDCDMEGIDNEEVGVNEVWEGVGSTTLGGIEWH